MLFERNNIEPEFDTALRRHLKISGSARLACAGFDPDLTSSYLEGGIGGEERDVFESHLAACRECRQHLLMLSRLTAELAAEPGARGRLSGLWERLAGEASRLMRPAQWGWHWGYGGAALAAAAMMLITATITYRMQPKAPYQLEADNAAAVAPSTSPAAPWDRQSDRQPDQIAASQAAAPAPSQPEAVRTAPSIPRPAIRAAATSDSNRVNGAISVPSAAFATAGALVPQASQRNASEPVALPEPASPQAQVVTVSPEPASDLAAIKLQLETESAPRIMPSPSDNPMRSVSFGARGGGPKSRESSAPAGRPGWADRVMGFMPQRRADKAEKSPAKAQPDNEESLAPLVRKLQGKTFHYERGVWVDEAYRSDLMAWRIVRLAQGSPELDKAVASEPALKEFFGLGRVILVWKDRVYKVN